MEFLTPKQNTRHVTLELDRATKVLTSLEKYEYASLNHATVVMLQHTMIRVGAAHVLDVKNIVSKFGIVLSAERQPRIKQMGSGSFHF